MRMLQIQRTGELEIRANEARIHFRHLRPNKRRSTFFYIQLCACIRYPLMMFDSRASKVANRVNAALNTLQSYRTSISAWRKIGIFRMGYSAAMHLRQFAYTAVLTVVAAVSLPQLPATNDIIDWSTSGPLLPANLSLALNESSLTAQEIRCDAYMYGGGLKRDNCLQALESMRITAGQKVYRARTDPDAADYRLPLMFISSESIEIPVFLQDC